MRIQSTDDPLSPNPFEGDPVAPLGELSAILWYQERNQVLKYDGKGFVQHFTCGAELFACELEHSEDVGELLLQEWVEDW